MERVDSSIFEDVKKDTENMLLGYPCEEIGEAKLYVVDDSGAAFARECALRLEMEYSQYPTKKGKKRPGRPVIESFSFDNIAKFINPNEPSSSHALFLAESWKQINDQEKVKSKLESQFMKYKHSVRKFTKEKMKKDATPKEFQSEILGRIEAEIATAEQRMHHILENFDDYDVRISTYYERTKHSALRWYVGKKRQQNVNLRKQVPNILWHRPLDAEDLIRPDNELIRYLQKAERVFGDVFICPRDDKEE